MHWRSLKSCRYIHLYEDPSAKTLDINVIKQYVSEKIPYAIVDARAEFTRYHLKGYEVDSFARRLASIRVKNPLTKMPNQEPLYGEVEYEKRVLKGEIRGSGVLYDGFELQTLLSQLIGEEESTLSHAHIVFTSRLFATWDEGDGRYHIRVIILGNPSIISTTGVAEGPAMPKEFYRLQQTLLAIGATQQIELMKERFRGRYIDYSDERLNEVMKGYVMQALFYQIFGEAFCSSRRCRLYNAHWQEELIEAQLSKQEFCDHHQSLLNQLKQDEEEDRGDDC
ncbi:MAG: hypothetical protein HA494_08115 [Thaumarchaeota archaeon]|nr:hypothetical protein [Nitrososphaerota archaeon]